MARGGRSSGSRGSSSSGGGLFGAKRTPAPPAPARRAPPAASHAVNMWYKVVYDFDDSFQGLKTTMDVLKTTRNWRYLRPEEQGPMWCPLGIAKTCIPLLLPPALTNERNHELSEETQKRVMNEISRKELDRIVASVSAATPTSSDAPSDTKEFESSASPTEDGFLHKIKVLGVNVWTFLSTTVRSVQNGCLRIVYGAMLLPHKLFCPPDNQKWLTTMFRYRTMSMRRG